MRFRFTTRRLMVGIALVAVATAGGLWARELSRWSESYQAVATQREAVRVRLARAAKVTRNPASRRAYEAHAAWYEVSRDAYARAAKSPWVSVPDDPPPDLGEALARARPQ